VNGKQLRVAFTGYYGMQNFGDDLFGALCCAAARQIWKADPAIVGPAIAGTRSRTTMPSWFSADHYGSGSVMGKASRMYSFMRALPANDVLILGGGSVINSGKSFRQPMTLAMHDHGGLKLAAVGVSIGPYETNSSQLESAKFLEKFSYICVRDKRSYELGRNMGLDSNLRLGRDLAGLLPLLEDPAAQRELDPNVPVRLGVALCNYSSKPGYPVPDRDVIQQSLVDAVLKITKDRPGEVKIFSLNEHANHGDHALSKNLLEQLKNAGIVVDLHLYGGDPMQTAREIGACDAFISARLHGAIVAYLQGVPFTIIDYHPKCADFATDIGLGVSQRITSENQRVEDLERALREMLEHRNRPKFPREEYMRQARDIFENAPWVQP